MKISIFERFTWNYIKSIALTHAEARCLILLALEVGDEPHRFAGKIRIYEWLDDLGVSFGYHKMVRDMEVEFYNRKSMAIRRDLKAIGSI